MLMPCVSTGFVKMWPVSWGFGSRSHANTVSDVPRALNKVDRRVSRVNMKIYVWNKCANRSLPREDK